MNNAESALIRVRDLEVIRDGKRLLFDVSLDIYPRQIVTLIGPNGAGKSTLVRCILGLMAYQAGEIMQKPGLRIGYMPQSLQLETLMPISVKRFLQLAPEAAPGHMQELIRTLRLEHLQESPLQALSGGELQRVLLARALMNRPEVLILDEPVQGVDISGQAELYRFIIQLCQEGGCGVLMVSHDLHIVMAGTDKVVCLNKHICCSGHPDEVTHDPAFVRLFGAEQASQLALYIHRHNHHHDHDEEID